jgi:hypothetical protein
MKALSDKLRTIINELGLDNDANCPDFIIADYLASCYVSFRDASNANAVWHAPFEPQPLTTVQAGRSILSRMSDDEYERLGKI